MSDLENQVANTEEVSSIVEEPTKGAEKGDKSAHKQGSSSEEKIESGKAEVVKPEENPVDKAVASIKAAEKGTKPVSDAVNKGAEKGDSKADKLKEDEDGNKVSDVRGIRAGCKVMKTRYAKPFESVQVKIPYDKGMDPYSGLVDMFEKQELLVKEGNRLKYTSLAGTEIKEFRKGWTGDKLDVIMADILSGGQKTTDDNISSEVEQPTEGE